MNFLEATQICNLLPDYGQIIHTFMSNMNTRSHPLLGLPFRNVHKSIRDSKVLGVIACSAKNVVNAALQQQLLI